jgi:hypothetical protein
MNRRLFAKLDSTLRAIVNEHATAQLISPQERLPTSQIGQTDFGYFAQVQGRNFDFGQKEVGRELSTCNCESRSPCHWKWRPSLQTTTFYKCQLRTDVDQCR